jgi:putative tryptophan/tyrosine transport system substrate-binding protein
MKRRRFLALLGSGAAVWPIVAGAQRLPVIGMLASASPDQWTGRLEAFRRGLAETGFVEGRNVAFEYRWAAGQNARLPHLASELVQRRVDVIVVLGNTSSALAAKGATRSVPVVFRVASNPVDIGLVASLGRPGGNITGVTTLGAELGPKQLDLLREVVPNVSAIALMVNPTNAVLSEILIRDVAAAARAVGVQLHIVKASTDPDFDAVFGAIGKLRAGGLLIGADTFFNGRSERLAALATRHGVPTISPYREFALTGGLLSYGGSINEASRLAGIYTGRILKGEKAGELPVQLATRLELIVNLKTAKALGLAVPLSVTARADEVIE